MVAQWPGPGQPENSERSQLFYVCSAHIQENTQCLTIKEGVSLSLETITQHETRRAKGTDKAEFHRVSQPDVGLTPRRSPAKGISLGSEILGSRFASVLTSYETPRK